MIKQLKCWTWNLHFCIRKSDSSSWDINNSSKNAVRYISGWSWDKEVVFCGISKGAIFYCEISWRLNSKNLILSFNVQSSIRWINQGNLGLNGVNQIHFSVNKVKFNAWHLSWWIQKEGKLAVYFIYNDITCCECRLKSYLKQSFIFVCAVNVLNICIWNVKLCW